MHCYSQPYLATAYLPLTCEIFDASEIDCRIYFERDEASGR
jgi:hypothetical protein